MNRRFEIKLIEENLNDDLEPVEFRWWKCSRINNMGEIKETNILTIKDICKDLADFYDRNDDTSFDPYKDSILFDKDQRIAELEEELKQWKDGTIIVKWGKAENRVKELEEENKNLKLCRCCECQSENEIMLQNTIRDLEEENAKLQEQMKNSIVPKYKKGDKVYILCPRGVKKGKISQVYYDTISGKMPTKENIAINYDVAFGAEDEMNYFEKDVYSTEDEAQKYLEEMT